MSLKVDYNPLLRKFNVRMGVNLTGFTCVNKIRDDV